jgi:hypothetical protein
MTLAKAKPRETSVEYYLISRVKALGGKTCKFVVPEENGHPDRLVKLPGCPAFLVELKRSREKPTELQFQRGREWRIAGMRWYWANSKHGVDLILATEGAELPS